MSYPDNLATSAELRNTISNGGRQCSGPSMEPSGFFAKLRARQGRRQQTIYR
jgi:hypothetical protein